MKKLWGILMLIAATSALGADVPISQLPSTNSVGDTHVVVVELVSGGATNTWQTTIANLRASIATLGSFATLATVNNASNVLIAYVNTATNGFVGASITNGFVTAQTLTSASNILVIYAQGLTNGFVGASITNGFVTQQVLTLSSNDIIAYVDSVGGGGGSATNAIGNLNGKGTNTVLWATSAGETNLTLLLSEIQQTFFAVGHTSSVLRAFTTAAGDGELMINDHSGEAGVRLRTGAGASFVGAMSGHFGIGTGAPQTTLHIVSDDEPNMIIESTANDIDHVRIQGTNGIKYIVLDSAGGFGRLVGLSNDLPKIVLSAGSDSYLIGGRLALGTNMPSHRLHVEGAIKSTVIAPNSLVATMAGGPVLTNLNYTPANLDSNFYWLSWVSNYTKGPPTEITGTNIDWTVHPRRYKVLTDDTEFLFSGTNDSWGVSVTLTTDGGGPYGITFPGIDVLPGGAALPTTIDAPIQLFFWKVNGQMYADFTGEQQLYLTNLVDVPFLNSPQVDDLLKFNGVGWTNSAGGGGGEANTMSSAGGISLLRPKSGVDLPVKGFDAGQFLADTNVMHIAAGVPLTNANLRAVTELGFAGDTLISAINAGTGGSSNVLTISGSPQRLGVFDFSNTSTFAVKGSSATNAVSTFTQSTGGTNNIIEARNAAGTLVWYVSTNGNQTVGGAMVSSGITVDSAGIMEFAARSKLVSLGNGHMGASNAANTARSSFTVGALTNTTQVSDSLTTTNIAIRTTTKTAASGTNWVVDFNEGEPDITAANITNLIHIAHSTNWPANAVGFSSWGITTGITNRHLSVAAFLTNHIYGTNSDVPVSTFLLKSNSFYRIPFEARGSNAKVYMGFPIRVAP